MKIRLLMIILFSLIISSQCLADELLIEPDEGRTPILSAINHSHHVKIVMYGLTDKNFIKAFANKDPQKEIAILLEPHPYKNSEENQYAIQKLKLSTVKILSPNTLFRLTHQKTFIFDDNNALIMTFNLTQAAFKEQRNFGLFINDPKMIAEINQVFANDAQQQSTLTHNPNLIWCPHNCRLSILNFIKSAKNNIKIYAQDLTDYEVVGALAQMARQGISVEIIMPPYQSSKKFTFLQKAGVHLYFNHEYYIHAKVIIIDDKKALLGSINLTKASLDDNRELSVIENDPKIVHQLMTTFLDDLKES